MHRKINQHNWDYFKNQLCESHLEQFGNQATYWQDFHQASVICSTDKNSISSFLLGIDGIKKIQSALIHDSHTDLKLISLPEASTINESLSQAILQRRSCRKNMIAKPLSFQNLSDFLYYGYGENPNGFRNVPSGGALYPLDIYVYCANIESVNPGLYYYSSLKHGLRKISGKREETELESFFADKEIYNIIQNASAYIFITASFLKNIWKYSERGYRFSLIEAGHMAQNINLIAAANQLACLNIGGFHDWEVNQFLGLNGILDANLYMVCVGYTQPS